MNLLQTILLYDFRSKRAVVYEDLAEMFETKQNMHQFLEQQLLIAKRTKQDSFARAFQLILGRFESDDGGAEISLAYLLGSIVPDSDLMALHAVDKTGAKEAGLRELASAVIRQKEMTMMMLKYVGIPALIAPMVGGLSYILGDIIVVIQKSTPDFMQDAIFADYSFNSLVRLLSNGMNDYGLEIAGVSVAMLAALAVIIPNYTGALRKKMEGWFGFSLYRDYQAAKFFSLLAMLLKAEYKLVPALEVLSGSGSRWMRWQVARILISLENEPDRYIDAFSQGICSPYVEGRLLTLNEIIKQKEARGDQSVGFSEILIRIGSVETKRAMDGIRKSAFAMNAVLLTTLTAYASIIGLGTMTVPGDFAKVADPNMIPILKQNYEAKKRAKQ